MSMEGEQVCVASPVSSFFSGRSVLVTGGTGFLGRALLEKLLRSCPGLDAVYLLVRPKRGADVNARLQHILDTPLFGRVRQECPGQLGKVVAVAGDISEPGLGLSSLEARTLQEAVSVVFHGAATVRFTEPLKVAVNVNLLGTGRVLDLCRGMPHLAAMVHISSCYANCVLDEIKEVVYPPPYDPESFAKCIEGMSNELVEKITPALLQEWPNTYTLTKALAETLVSAASKDIPVTIVRPSAVVSSLSEPTPGWVHGFGALNGLTASCCQGNIRAIRCDPDQTADIIPVDMVVSATICAAWSTATLGSREALVYNICSGNSNPVTFGRWFKVVKDTVKAHPSPTAYFAPPRNALVKNLYLHRVCEFFLQLVPAYFEDWLRLLVGQSSRMALMQHRIIKRGRQIEYFTIRSFNFKDDRTRQLLSQLSPVDRKIFNFDVVPIDWEKYNENYTQGVRIHLLKCTENTDKKTI